MEQKQIAADEIFKSRCVKKLRELGLPTVGWMCDWVEDMEEPDYECELCGCTRVRFLHHMRHYEAPCMIAVGCMCDGIMSGDELGAIEREQQARNRAKRKKNFIHGPWTQTRQGPSRICWTKKMRRGPICMILQNADGRYAVWHNSHWCYLNKGKPIRSFAQAASALFTVNDPKREQA